jgi:hypothetical protein
VKQNAAVCNGIAFSDLIAEFSWPRASRPVEGAKRMFNRFEWNVRVDGDTSIAASATTAAA